MPILKSRLIHKVEIPFLASFLAGIFFDSGVYVYLFPDSETRQERLEWLFEKNLLLQNAEKNTWVLVTDGVFQITEVQQITASITFLPSAERKSTLADYIKRGLLAMPFRFGFEAFKNLLNANKTNEAGIRQIAGGKPYWYLTMVAVAETHRRKGIAKQLIKDIIECHCDRQAFDRGYSSILLTTQLGSNVSLYEQLGFLVMASGTQNSYTNWTMKKDLVQQTYLPNQLLSSQRAQPFNRLYIQGTLNVFIEVK